MEDIQEENYSDLDHDIGLFLFNALSANIDPVATTTDVEPAEPDPEFWLSEITLAKTALKPVETVIEDDTITHGVDFGTPEHQTLTQLACISGLFIEKMLYFDIDKEQKELVIGIDKFWTEEQRLLLTNYLEMEDDEIPLDSFVSLVTEEQAALSIRVQHSNCFVVNTITGIKFQYHLDDAFFGSDDYNGRPSDNSKLELVQFTYEHIETTTYNRSEGQDLTTFTLPIIVLDKDAGDELDTMSLAYSLSLNGRADRNRIMDAYAKEGITTPIKSVKAEPAFVPPALNKASKTKRKNKNKAAKKARKRKK